MRLERKMCLYALQICFSWGTIFFPVQIDYTQASATTYKVNKFRYSHIYRLAKLNLRNPLYPWKLT